MTERELNVIACALVLRTRENLEITSALEERFGFVPVRCDLAEIKRMGGKQALVSFWRSVVETDPEMGRLAESLLGTHSTISPPPGVLTDAWTFAQALRAEARALLDGEEAVSREVAGQRLAVCKSCPALKRSRAGSRCKLCRCFVSLKTKFRSAACPVGKW